MSHWIIATFRFMLTLKTVGKEKVMINQSSSEVDFPQTEGNTIIHTNTKHHHDNKYKTKILQ